MDDLQRGLSATSAVLTVELELQRVAAGARPPAPLTPTQAEHLAQAVASDLRRILGEDLQEYGLILAGAFYDLTELLQPGLPFIETLLELYRGSLPQGRFQPQVVAIGSQNEEFPVRRIAPARRPGSGPLLAVPLVFVGAADAIDRLETRLEEVLLEAGRAELPTEMRLREDAGLQPVNLSYVTVNDLCALLKIQLEQNQLDGLWQLLESALYRPGEKTRVSLPSGNLFYLQGNEAYTPFYTFDQWAAVHGGGAEAAQRYGDWVKLQRQYMAGLGAHGVRVLLTAGDAEFTSLCANSGLERARQRVLPDQELLRENAAEGALSGASIIVLTEQATAELGPVAYTVLVQAAAGGVLQLSNEYPLRPEAIHRIRDHWAAQAQALGVEVHLARPGRLVTSEDGSHLVPDLDTVGGPH